MAESQGVALDLFDAYHDNLTATGNNPAGHRIMLCPLCLGEIERQSVESGDVPLEHILPHHSTTLGEQKTRYTQIATASVRSGLTITCPTCNQRKGRVLDWPMRGLIVPGAKAKDDYPPVTGTAILTYAYLMAFCVHGYECGKRSCHCFELDIGCDLIVACPGCGADNGLDANDRTEGTCRCCGKAVPFPDVGGDPITICFQCLRDGRGAITSDTELGMISGEQVHEGHTHGAPGLSRDDFEMVELEDGWVGAKLEQELMLEILRTPNYDTIQGERWQFCCQQPMVYIGCWSREDFSARSPDGEGRKYFEAIVQDVVPGLWEDELHDETGVYVFTCRRCARMTAHWDLA